MGCCHPPNLRWQDVNMLRNHNLSADAEIKLCSCNAGLGDTAIAAHIAAATRRNVVAPNTSLNFSNSPNQTLLSGRPSDGGPILMTPIPDGAFRTFSGR